MQKGRKNVLKSIYVFPTLPCTLEYFECLFNAMICHVSNIKLLLKNFPTKYTKNDAKVGVPNLVYGLKRAP